MAKDDASDQTPCEMFQRTVRKSDCDEVLTVGGAAELLRLSLNSVYAAVSRGDIPHQRIGRNTRFSRAGLLSWLAQSKL